MNKLKNIFKNKKISYSILGLFIIIVSVFLINGINRNINNKTNTNEIDAMVLTNNDGEIVVQDNNNVIYTFSDDSDVDIGSNVHISCVGKINKNKNYQDCDDIKLDVISVVGNSSLPDGWNDNGIFSKYYDLAYDKLKGMSLDEKIGQLLLVRYPDNNAISDLKKYKFSGFVFYEKDFKNKDSNQVKSMIKELQANSSIPLLTAVDEEGGNVVRVSSNPMLASEKFKSPSELYNSGGMDLIKKDTINKSKLLSSLGLNLNLAPVVDVSTDPSSYMYPRTIQKNTDITSLYAKTVITTSREYPVSYTLKHFPGYGNNADTHSGGATDSRSYNDILTNDLPPFKAGIDVGAEAILVSHNTVDSIDSSNPASLSVSVHNLLRNELDFTGIIITDDIDMGATNGIGNAVVKALLAGNDLVITTDYARDVNNIKNAINNGTISEDLIDKLAVRVLAWKYYKGLMFENQK